ncbi:MAG: alpha/beta hydrolase [Verrucomicrobiales bacterium]|nr:alpha/beta hydrolase [Verrucomicrobiales bacterium]
MIRRILKFLGWSALALLVLVAAVCLYFFPFIERQDDIGYTSRNGVQLSYDVLTPRKQNGAAILIMVSGSWKSQEGPFHRWIVAPLLRRGYTVFAVRHLSQPKATVTEIVEDLNRAVRHIRFHSANYGIAKDRFGVSGGSSGGHLSLMLATRGGEPEKTDAPGAIDLESSAVQAAAVFFPVTDLVDLGPSTQNPGDGGPPTSYVKGFGFTPKPDDRKHIPKAEMPRWKEVAHELSPIHQLSPGLPPIRIIHGDADTLVPLDQSLRFLEKAKELGIDDRIDLQIRNGKGHGWLTMIFDLPKFADWYDQHLAPAS